MGYPMSYQRVIHRNGLATGGYDDAKPPKVGKAEWPGPERFDAGVDYIRVCVDEIKRRGQVIEEMHNQRRMLLGDLRRLEADSIDEGATCATVAHKTGVDPEVVAAVIREFLRW